MSTPLAAAYRAAHADWPTPEAAQDWAELLDGLEAVTAAEARSELPAPEVWWAFERAAARLGVDAFCQLVEYRGTITSPSGRHLYSGCRCLYCGGNDLDNDLYNVDGYACPGQSRCCAGHPLADDTALTDPERRAWRLLFCKLPAGHDGDEHEDTVAARLNVSWGREEHQLLAATAEKNPSTTITRDEAAQAQLDGPLDTSFDEPFTLDDGDSSAQEGSARADTEEAPEAATDEVDKDRGTCTIRWTGNGDRHGWSSLHTTRAAVEERTSALAALEPAVLDDPRVRALALTATDTSRASTKDMAAAVLADLPAPLAELAADAVAAAQQGAPAHAEHIPGWVARCLADWLLEQLSTRAKHPRYEVVLAVGSDAGRLVVVPRLRGGGPAVADVLTVFTRFAPGGVDAPQALAADADGLDQALWGTASDAVAELLGIDPYDIQVCLNYARTGTCPVSLPTLTPAPAPHGDKDLIATSQT